MLVLLTVTIPLMLGSCQLDSAIVTAIPPNTVHVIAISDCGALRCWTRWIETNGVRLGEVRACSGEGGNTGDRFEAVPPASASPRP